MARKSSTVACAAGLLLLCHASPWLHAQQAIVPEVDLAVTFQTQRSLQLNSSQNFWAKGGGIELGVDAFHGLGIAANISGVHAASIGSTGTPLSVVTATFGPRYRWHGAHRVSVYGEGLLGEANAFNSLFPSAEGAQSDANALALRAGGGVDIRCGGRVSIRALDAAWLRTQFPNSSNNVQNNLLLGAGVVFHTRR